MHLSRSSAAVIYAHADDAKRAPVKLQPIESSHLYKSGREAELLAYRSACRAICMHSGKQLTKGQRRILEDLAEQWCVSPQRAAAELQAALEDPLVTSVAASGVLRRREEFFDGVADVPLEALSEAVVARDDGASLYAPPQKVQRTEVASTDAPTALRRVAPAKSSQTALHKIVVKVGQEVTAISNRMLAAVSAADRERCKQELLARREHLHQMLREADGNLTDVSRISSTNPSEHGF